MVQSVTMVVCRRRLRPESTATISPRGICGAVWLGVLVLASAARAGALSSTDAALTELPQPPAAGDVSFRGWAERVAAAEGASLGGLWTVELDGDPTLERAARLCRDEHVHTLLIEDPDTGQRWRVSEDAWDRAPPCPAVGSVDWEHADDGLTLSDGVAGEHRERWLGIRDGRLVEAAHLHARAAANVSELEVRWDLRTILGRIDGAFGAERGIIDREGWIVTTGGEPEIVTPYLRSGGVRWSGEEDASLSLGASITADGRARLEIRVRDDDRIAAERLEATKGVDHLELWWAAPGADVGDPFGEEGTARGLSLVPMQDGNLLVSWLGDGQGPLPEVTGGLDRLQVVLPIELRAGVPVPLSVSFSDVDGQRGNAPTVIASSRLLPGQPGTFGWLVHHADAGGQYPLLGERLESVDPSASEAP